MCAKPASSLLRKRLSAVTVRTKKLRHELCGNVVSGGIISAWKEENILNSMNSKSLSRMARCLQAGEKAKSIGTKLLEDLQCLKKALKYFLQEDRATERFCAE